MPLAIKYRIWILIKIIVNSYFFNPLHAMLIKLRCLLQVKMLFDLL